MTSELRVIQEAQAIADAYDEEHPETAPTRPRVASKWPALRVQGRPCYCGHLKDHHGRGGCQILVAAKVVCPCEAYSANRLDEDFPDLAE